MQALADAMTIRERLGALEGVRLAYLGDGNNVCHSLMRIAGRFGMHVTVAAAARLRAGHRRRRGGPRRRGGARRQRRRSPPTRARRPAGRRCSTRTCGRAWARRASASVGSATWRRTASTASLLELADPDATVLHCLPAHVGEEITADVLYGPRSLVWDQAENRLHTQKAVLALVIA